MSVEELEKKLESKWNSIASLQEKVQEIMNQISSEEIWSEIYGAILYYNTHDWEGNVPPFVDFLKDTLTKESFDFWRRHKDMFE